MTVLVHPLVGAMAQPENRGYTSPCWVWRRYKDRDGYGKWGRGQLAHRVAYECLVGPIPDGLHIDHLCRVRACVNPRHLEPVTLAENNRRQALFLVRKTHCKYGHEYTLENTHFDVDGHRECRTCRRLRGQGGPFSERDLSVPMRDLLWTVAQHKYGWTHVSRHGRQLQVADALVRRELVCWGRHDREHSSPTIVATDAGRAEIARRWPVSPMVLGTYDHQPGGWDPVEGRNAGRDRERQP